MVSVRERNFDPEKLPVRAPGAVPGEWKRGPSGDPETWTMELQFPMDGAYTLDVTGTDALGNTASVSYTGEAPQSRSIGRRR